MIKNVAIVLLILTLGITMCQNSTLKEVHEAAEQKQKNYIHDLKSINSTLNQEVTAYRMNAVEVDDPSKEVSDGSAIKIVYRTDNRAQAKLDRQRKQFASTIEALATQRDLANHRVKLLQEYCDSLTTQMSTDTLSSEQLVDSLIENTMPWVYTQVGLEDGIQWYTLDMIVETRDTAHAEFYWIDEYVVDLKKIKKSFWETILFKPRKYEVNVVPLNPYSINTEGVSYFFNNADKIKNK